MALFIELIKIIDEDFKLFNSALISILKYIRVLVLFLEICDVSILELIFLVQDYFEEGPQIYQDPAEIDPLVVPPQLPVDQPQLPVFPPQAPVDQPQLPVVPPQALVDPIYKLN